MPLAVLCACLRPVSPEYPSGNGLMDAQMVETQMALAFKPGSGVPSTRMLDSVTQADANSDYSVFRGIEQLFVIPFNTRGAITASDSRYSRNLELPHTGIAASFGTDASDGTLPGLVLNNNSHLYRDVYLKNGTSSLLAYGMAIDQSVAATPTDSVNYKRRNGVLRAHGLEGAETPVDMGFNLEPLVDATAEAAISSKIAGIVTYFNSIANAQDTYYGYYTFANYNTSDYQSISNFFKSFTNGGTNGTAGQAFSGSTRALAVLLSQLYTSARDLYNSATSNWTKGMCNGIMTAINNSNYVTVSGTTVTFNSAYADFPSSFGIPDGSVAIEWDGSAFLQVSAANSAMAPTGSYCYPPSLWYWTNSTLLTSDAEDLEEEYKSSNPDWASILGHYTLGTTIRRGITSVAIVRPMQYGVAQLRLKFNYAISDGGTANLLDSRANAVNVSNSNFPFTGVLVSEQRNLAYNFTPKSGNSYCIYDPEVNNGSTPKAYIASSASGLTFQPVHTLVVQTDDNQDVHYALEFQNNSGSAFYGVNGCTINPGSKFYLIGILNLQEATNNTGETISSVFLQDHITEAVITVKGLAKSYNTVPELRDPQLEIGVQTEMKWVESTPAHIPMY